jgi:hypothetical protein
MRPRKSLARRLGRRLGKDMGLRPHPGRKGIVAERAPVGGIIEPGTSDRPEALREESYNCHSVIAARVRELFKRLGCGMCSFSINWRLNTAFMASPRLAARATRMPRSNTGTSAGPVLPVKEVLGRNAACGIAEAS